MEKSIAFFFTIRKKQPDFQLINQQLHQHSHNTKVTNLFHHSYCHQRRNKIYKNLPAMLMKQEVERIAYVKGLSKNVYEIVSTALI